MSSLVSPALGTNDVVLIEYHHLEISGMTFDAKLTFENLRMDAKPTSQRIVILRRAWRLFGCQTLLRRCYLRYMLPLLEYYSPVWGSGDESHLRLFDRAVSGAASLFGVSL